MKVVVVLADDRPVSLIRAISNTVVDTIRTHQIELEYLDLYEWDHQIPFYYNDRSKLESFPFFKMTRDQIMSADRLVLIFPVYWYSTPAIMKCWIDLITNYAWKYEGSLYARPLHHIKQAMIISTTMSPNWYNFLIRHPAQQQVKRTLRWMGIKRFVQHEFGGAQQITLDNFKHIEHKIIQLTTQLIR